MTKMNRTDGLIILVSAIPIILFLVFFGDLPDQMAVHFGVDGSPNRYQGKISFLLIFSLFLLAYPFLFKGFRKIDPKSENYKKFGRTYEIFRFSLSVLLSGAFTFIILYNLGYPINIQLFTLLGIGLLFLIIGNYMGQIRPTYFIGIRTPWTMANDEVWRKTHRIGGPLFMVTGVVFLVAAFLPGPVTVWLCSFFLFITVAVPVIFSYIQFKKVEGKG
ncbi:SdpI family protein [Ammoniphilus sp. YIM 78166]|uniref:SdpI family protein n=1 Tax=Ammoniphilus sp. YIM 78166 TaxID=1644106 RepID=UPI00106F3A6C|nr:SdpI family protein [Ammoniphilus sp. YIM 78166]